MPDVVCVFVSILLVLFLISILVLLDLVIRDFVCLSIFKKLEKLDRIDVDECTFKLFYWKLEEMIPLNYFRIVYFKDGLAVIKLKNQYFAVSKNLSLIYLYDEEKSLIDSIEKSKKKLVKDNGKDLLESLLWN